jgi:hypothetical protein
MTTTTTLTDRYVEATLRRLPGRQRPDIEKELRASIADAVDDRLHAGNDPAEAERAVLTELGDPARLADGYADRPLQLIGPALYRDYTRLVAALLATVLPAVAVALVVAQTLHGDGVGSVVSQTIGVTFTVGVHLVFWTTLMFAAIERAPRPRTTSTRAWTLAEIPEPSGPRARYAVMIAETVLLGLFTTFLLLSPKVSTERDASGDPIGVLSPWLWQTGIVYVFIAFAIASLGFTFAKRQLPWTAPVAVTRSLVDAVCPAVLIYLAANDRMVNPAFVSAVDWPPQAPQWIATGLVLLAVAALIRVIVELVAGFLTRTWETPDWKSLIHTAVDGLSRLPGR